MELDILCQEVEQDVYVFPNNIEKILMDLILLKYSKKRELHYCWDNFKPSHRLELKVKPTNKFYNVIWNKITDRQKVVLLAIDGTCIQGKDKLVLIEIEKLYSLLEKYYWELDEIYICDLKFNWLITVNHMFEFNFIGDGIIEFMQELMKDEECSSCVIHCAEYE